MCWLNLSTFCSCCLPSDRNSLYFCAYFYSVYVNVSSLCLCVTQPAIPSVPPRFLTSGSWDVTLLCALDEKAGKMYVRATEHGEPPPITLYAFTGGGSEGWDSVVFSIKIIIAENSPWFSLWLKVKHFWGTGQSKYSSDWSSESD